MSDGAIEDQKESKLVKDNTNDAVKDDNIANEPQYLDIEDEKVLMCTQDLVVKENPMSSCKEEEEIMKKKYGGLLQKKHPLISKDHERAFFDSADWALNKQGSQTTKGSLEALRPKLEPSPHHQLRARSPYARLDDTEVQSENAATLCKYHSGNGNSAELDSNNADDQTRI